MKRIARKKVFLSKLLWWNESFDFTAKKALWDLFINNDLVDNPRGPDYKIATNKIKSYSIVSSVPSLSSMSYATFSLETKVTISEQLNAPIPEDDPRYRLPHPPNYSQHPTYFHGRSFL